MPELPEVETIVRGLQRHVRGATITDVEVLKPDLIGGPTDAFVRSLRNARIEDISRRAKNIVIRLDGDRLIINLGMTGRTLVLDGKTPDPPYTGVRFALADGRRLVYQDVRRFGRLEVLPAAAWEARAEKLGLEPLSPEFTPQVLHTLTRRSRMAIKPWLMDQNRVVGVGNIYANEALFRARLNPRKAAGRLTRPEAERLHAGIREVLNESIEFRGTTLLDYRDADGEEGAFAARLRVYDREGEPCVNCGTPIRRIVQAGRSTFFCPKCQK